MTFFLLSVFLTVFAPVQYSYEYCVLINILFWVQNLIYFQFKEESTWVCFEFFFMLSFWFINFVYPVFYYGGSIDFTVYKYPYNHEIICKSTALAYMAYTSYMMGISYKITQKISLRPSGFVFTIENRTYRILFIISIVSFLGYSYFGGFEALRSVYSGNARLDTVGVYSYFQAIYHCSLLLLTILSFVMNNKRLRTLIWIFVFLSIVLVLATGSRGFAFRLVLMGLLGYDLVFRHIKKYDLLLITLVGALALFFIMLARSVDITAGNWFQAAVRKANLTSPLDIFSDLIMNTRNLYLLVDYADNVGYTYFTGMLSDITAPIPMLFRCVSQHIDLPRELMVSGSLPTYLTFGKDAGWGLGTALVGEAYVAFGYVGILVCFVGIGWIVRVSRNAMYQNKYAMIIYFLFVSHAIFYPRAPLLFDPRMVAWCLLMIYLVSLKIKVKTNT